MNLYCPECGEPIWDGPKGSKLARCWNVHKDGGTLAFDTMDGNSEGIALRLEYLRGEIDAEQISLDELIELQGLADHIEPGDVQLAEAAGIDEEEFARRSA